MTILEHCERVAQAISDIDDDAAKAAGIPSYYTGQCVVKPRKKYIALDIHHRVNGNVVDEKSGSGAWMVEAATGEIYNIKGYGVPDKNKKNKADIGNIATVDPVTLLSKRWNYLR